MARSIAVGVVGAGRWGEILIQKLVRHPEVRAVVVYEAKEERRAEILGRLPTIRTVCSLHELLTDSQVDAVVVATPTESHGEVGLRVLQANLHLLIEKPMATTVEQASLLVDEARRRGRTLMVGHTPQYSAAATEVQRTLERGRIGDVRSIQAIRINRFDPDIDPDTERTSPRALLWDLAAHDVALMLGWLGRAPWASRASSVLKESDWIQTSTEARLRFKIELLEHPCEIVIGQGTERRREIKVRGTHGDLRWASCGMEDELILNPIVGRPQRLEIPSFEPLRGQFDHFFKSVRGQTVPLSDGEHGLAVVTVLVSLDQQLAV